MTMNMTTTQSMTARFFMTQHDRSSRPQVTNELIMNDAELGIQPAERIYAFSLLVSLSLRL